MKIIQLNLNHCETAHDLLMQTVRELKPDVAVISEPYRHLSTRLWGTDAGARAAIWSCGGHPFQGVVDGTETGFVRAMLDGIYFYSCYAPPSLSIDEFTNFLDRLTEDVKQHSPVAIAGDFNAWATDWGSKKTNAKGQALLEAMSLLDVVLLNSGDKPTFTRREASSIVDLTFVSSNLAKRNCSWEVTDTYTASDHSAIRWEIPASRRTGPTPKKTNSTGWKVSTFDPSSFREAFDDRPISGSNATEKANDLMRRITEACDVTMPRKSNANRLPPVYWWNNTIAALRKECIRARRASQRGRKKPNSEELEAKYKGARGKLNKAIKSSKNRYLDNLREEVESDLWGRPYKAVMARLRCQPIPSPVSPALLKKIVTVLFPQQPKLDHQIEQCEVGMIPTVTREELLEASGRMGNTKAPGMDGVPNVALRAAINEAPGVFLDVYNACLQEGTFPAKWKQQRLVLLPKGKGQPEEPSSYRPLCMLDTAGKILERIVHRRIEAAAEPHLANNQYGFRRGRSTLDAIDLVVGTAREAISGTRWKGGKKEYCLVVTLDIRNAFNSTKWNCIMEALVKMGVPGYLRRMVVGYFTDRVLKYDTENGPKEYRVTGGVPQGSVLGPLLWNIMYDGLLRLGLPGGVRLVAFADDVAIVIVAKHLEEINYAFDVTFERIRRWMDSVGLELAEHKTEAVLITGRRRLETITLRVGDHGITSQLSIRYLGVMIDARLSFGQEAVYVGTRAAAVRAVLSRLMPNIGGPRQRKRALLTSVVTSVLTYGIAIWADALRKQKLRRRVAPVYRLGALRVASAYRTVSEDAVCVIAGMLPIDVLAEERRSLYQRKRTTALSAAELRTEERQKSLRRWQLRWDASASGRWTHRLITQVDTWVNRTHGEVNYYLTQMLSGHGCFRAYLYKYKHEDSPECPTCTGVEENAEHVFFVCPRFIAPRNTWRSTVGERTGPENLVEVMLATVAAWEATSSFTAEVLKDLRREEQERKKEKQKEKTEEQEARPRVP